MVNAWLQPKINVIQKAVAEARERDRRLEQSKALTSQKYDKKKKKGVFGFIRDAAIDTVEFGQDVAQTGAGLVKEAADQTLSGLNTYGNFTQSVPAALFTQGQVQDGQYTTKRNLWGNPLSNIQSHMQAQRDAGLINEDVSGLNWNTIKEGIKAQERMGQAYQEDPDISEGVKFGSSILSDPTTYLGAGLLKGIGRKAPEVVKRGVTKVPMLKPTLKGVTEVAAGFERPASPFLFAAGGGAAAEAADQLDAPGWARFVAPMAGGSLAGVSGVAATGAYKGFRNPDGVIARAEKNRRGLKSVYELPSKEELKTQEEEIRAQLAAIRAEYDKTIPSNISDDEYERILALDPRRMALKAQLTEVANKRDNYDQLALLRDATSGKDLGLLSDKEAQSKLKSSYDYEAEQAEILAPYHGSEAEFKRVYEQAKTNYEARPDIDFVVEHWTDMQEKWARYNQLEQDAEDAFWSQKNQVVSEGIEDIRAKAERPYADSPDYAVLGSHRDLQRALVEDDSLDMPSRMQMSGQISELAKEIEHRGLQPLDPTRTPEDSPRDFVRNGDWGNEPTQVIKPPSLEPVAKEPTGLEHLSDADLETGRSKLDSYPLPESDKRVLISSYDRELRNRGFSMGITGERNFRMPGGGELPPIRGNYTLRERLAGAKEGALTELFNRAQIPGKMPEAQAVSDPAEFERRMSELRRQTMDANPEVAARAEAELERLSSGRSKEISDERMAPKIPRSAKLDELTDEELRNQYKEISFSARKSGEIDTVSRMEELGTHPSAPFRRWIFENFRRASNNIVLKPYKYNPEEQTLRVIFSIDDKDLGNFLVHPDDFRALTDAPDWKSEDLLGGSYRLFNRFSRTVSAEEFQLDASNWLIDSLDKAVANRPGESDILSVAGTARSYVDSVKQRREVEGGRSFFDRPIGGGANPEVLVTPKEVTPGLTKSEKVGGLITRAIKTAFGPGTPPSEVATPIVREARRMHEIVRTQGNRLARIAGQAEKVFGVDKNGLTKLNGEDVTLADIAQNYPKYEPFLNPTQKSIMDALRRGTDSAAETLRQFGVDITPSETIADGGFYLPRDRAAYGNEIVPEIRNARTAAGIKMAAEKPRHFDTQAEGISRGYTYPAPHEAVAQYFHDLANRTTETWIANEVKKLPKPEGKARSGSVKLFQTSGVHDVPVPVEVQDVINKHLNEIHGLTSTDSEKIYSAVNNTMRGLWASMDLSRLFIQDLLMAVDNPMLAGKAWKTSLQTLWDKNVVSKFIQNLDEKNYGTDLPTSTDWVRSGLHLANSSGNDYEGGIVTHLSKTPVIGKGLEKTQRFFTDGGDINRLLQAQYMYENWRHGGIVQGLDAPKGATREQVMEAIANAANRSSGYSKNVFGGDVGRATLFAPRFLQAQLEGIVKAFERGTIEGQVARRQLIKLIGVGGAITVLANEARGEETEFLPWEKNFMRIRNVRGNDISLFGPWDSLVRGVLRSNPIELENGDFKFDPGNSTYLVRSKLAPILSTATDLLVGTNVVGEPTRNLTSVAANLTMPFSARQALTFEDGKPKLDNPLATGLSALGLKSSELTRAEKLENMLDEAGIKKSDPDYNIKRRQWMFDHPDKVPPVERGDYKRASEVQKDILARREANESMTKTDEQSLVDFRESRKDLLLEQRSRLDEILGDDDRKGNTKQDKWLSSYFDLFDKAKNAKGEIDSDKFDPLVAEWTETNGREALDYIDRYLGSAKGEVEKAYYDDLLRLKKDGFFEMDKYRGMTSGLTEDQIDKFKEQVISWRLEDPRRQSQSFAASTQAVLGESLSLEQMRDIVNSNKEAYASPEMTKFRETHRKELMWFNPNANWTTYTNAVNGVKPGKSMFNLSEIKRKRSNRPSIFAK